MTARYIYAADLYPRTDPVNGARLTRLTSAQAHEVREDANGPGTGALIINGDRTDAQFIEAPEPGKVGAQYVRSVRIDTQTVDGSTLSGFVEQVVAGFFLEKGDFEALTKRQTRKLTFGGAGPEAILERVVMANVTYVAGAEGPFDGEWHWYFSDPGEILHRAIQEANEASRPQSPIPGVTVDFTQLVDSDGNAWAGHGTTWIFTFPSGRPVTELIARLREHGLYVRVDPDTFVVSAWPTTAYRTTHDFSGVAWGAGVVRFQKSTDGDRATGNILDDAKRGVEVYKRRSHLLVGKDDTWEWVAAAPLPDVVYEGSFTVEDEEGNAFPSLGAIQLNARDDAGDTARIRFKCQASDPSNGQYLPFDDVLPNYLVTAHSGATEWDWSEAEFPVAAIILKVRRTGIGDAWVDLGATFREAGDRDPSAGPVPHHTHTPNPRICRDTPGAVFSSPLELLMRFRFRMAVTTQRHSLEILLKDVVATATELQWVINNAAGAGFSNQMGVAALELTDSVANNTDGPSTQGILTTVDDVWCFCRLRVDSGGQAQIRLWKDGSGEPGTWDVETDDAPVDVDGSVPFINRLDMQPIAGNDAAGSSVEIDYIQFVSGFAGLSSTESFNRTVASGAGTSDWNGVAYDGRTANLSVDGSVLIDQDGLPASGLWGLDFPAPTTCIHGGPAANSGDASVSCGKCVAAGNHEHDYVPEGGTTGQMLVKASDADYAGEWVDTSTIVAASSFVSIAKWLVD